MSQCTCYIFGGNTCSDFMKVVVEKVESHTQVVLHIRKNFPVTEWGTKKLFSFNTCIHVDKADLILEVLVPGP